MDLCLPIGERSWHCAVLFVSPHPYFLCMCTLLEFLVRCVQYQVLCAAPGAVCPSGKCTAAGASCICLSTFNVNNICLVCCTTCTLR